MMQLARTITANYAPSRGAGWPEEPPRPVCASWPHPRRTASRPSASGGVVQRSVAANSLSSALRILARTPAMSFSPSVRSGERITTRSARERLSAGT